MEAAFAPSGALTACSQTHLWRAAVSNRRQELKASSDATAALLDCQTASICRKAAAALRLRSGGACGAAVGRLGRLPAMLRCIRLVYESGCRRRRRMDRACELS